MFVAKSGCDTSKSGVLFNGMEHPTLWEKPRCFPVLSHLNRWCTLTLCSTISWLYTAGEANAGYNTQWRLCPYSNTRRVSLTCHDASNFGLEGNLKLGDCCKQEPCAAFAGFGRGKDPCGVDRMFGKACLQVGNYGPTSSLPHWWLR